MRKQRLGQEKFFQDVNLERIKNGFFTDVYFNRTGATLRWDDHHPEALMQIFSKKDSVVCGIDEAIALLKIGTGFYENGKFVNCWDKLRVKALYDGERARPDETIMTIEGDYSLFAHLETVYLGVLARGTKIATNVNQLVQVSAGKPVFFFAARFDHFVTQRSDGYAALTGGASGVSTDAQGDILGVKGLGSTPHGLIAAYNGDTVRATTKYVEWAEQQEEKIDVIALVDFENNCVKTSLDVARALGRRIFGVRLDTSGSMVDKSLNDQMGRFYPLGVKHRDFFY